MRLRFHICIYEKQGLAMGVVVGGFGGGAFIFNQIQVEKIFFKYLIVHRTIIFQNNLLSEI